MRIINIPALLTASINAMVRKVTTAHLISVKAFVPRSESVNRKSNVLVSSVLENCGSRKILEQFRTIRRFTVLFFKNRNIQMD